MNSTKYDENIKLMLKATKMNDLESSILPAPDLGPHDHAAEPDEHAKDTHYPDISQLSIVIISILSGLERI